MSHGNMKGRDSDAWWRTVRMTSTVSFVCLKCAASLSIERSGDIYNVCDVRCECGEIYEVPRPQIKVKENFTQADEEWRAKRGR